MKDVLVGGSNYENLYNVDLWSALPVEMTIYGLCKSLKTTSLGENNIVFPSP